MSTKMAFTSPRIAGGQGGIQEHETFFAYLSLRKGKGKEIKTKSVLKCVL